ncbi:MAG TPA: signal peptidase I [Arthrobacter sp.]
MTAISLTPARGRRRAEHAPGIASALLLRVPGPAVTALLLLCASTFLFLAVGPHLLPYQTSTMLTGSMSPGINPGDVVVSASVPISDLHVGDVITYQIPVADHRVETHRIIEINTDGAAVTVRTQGDANNAADPWTAVMQGESAYRQIGTVPSLGQAIRALRDPIVSKVLVYGAPGALIAFGLVSIWRRKPADA